MCLFIFEKTSAKVKVVRSKDVQKKFKVAFKNQIDLEVFSKDFFQILLDNVIKLKEHKENQIDNRTCACLDTSKHVFLKRSVNENMFSQE